MLSYRKILYLVSPAAILSAGPAHAASGLTADQGFWLVGFSLLFGLTLAAQAGCYLRHRRIQQKSARVRARSGRTRR